MIRGLDEYRFNDATAAVYQFVWHEFCDWYLELVKPVLYGGQDAAAIRAAQKTLIACPEDLSEAAPPLHAVPDRGDLADPGCGRKFDHGERISRAGRDGVGSGGGARDGPHHGGDHPDPEHSRGDECRPVSEAQGDPGRTRRHIRTTLEKGRIYITNLANLESLTVTGETTEPKGAATAVAGPVQVYVFLAGVIDIAGEESRLRKETRPVDKDLAFVSGKLANPEFLAKAAETVVMKEQEKARALGEKQAALEAARQRLAALAAGINIPARFMLTNNAK